MMSIAPCWRFTFDIICMYVSLILGRYDANIQSRQMSPRCLFPCDQAFKVESVCLFEGETSVDLVAQSARHYTIGFSTFTGYVSVYVYKRRGGVRVCACCAHVRISLPPTHVREHGSSTVIARCSYTYARKAEDK